MRRIFIGLFVVLLAGALTWSQPASLTTVPLASHQLAASTEPLTSLDDYESEIITIEDAFNLLAFTWEGEGEIDVQLYDGEWSNWQHVHEDLEGEQGEHHQGFLITNNATAFQYRAEGVQVLQADAINGGTKPLLSRLTFGNSSVKSRSSWGANDDLLLKKNYKISSSENSSDDEELPGDLDPDLKIEKQVNKDSRGNEYLWPQEYPRKVKKIIIHHTASTKYLNNPEKAIRAIYHYHAQTRGWGDIGYNFIIDEDGEIYHGRAGDDGVVGAHTAGYNTGSVGIALLGDFSDDPIEGPMMQSLLALVKEKAELHDIDIDGRSDFKDERFKNLLGHRDLGATACPGEITYEFLDEIREILSSNISNEKDEAEGSFPYKEVRDRELITLGPDGKDETLIKLKNTGSKTWSSSTYLKLKSMNGVDSEVDSKIKMRENSVAPGKTATFGLDLEAQGESGLAYLELTPMFNGNQAGSQNIDVVLYIEQASLDFSVFSENAPSILRAGESSSVTLKLQNTGNMTWKNKGSKAVLLKTKGSSTLSSSSTLAKLQESSVEPGERGTFKFTVTAPKSTSGTQKLSYTLVMDGVDALEESHSIKIKVLGGGSSSSTSSSSSSSSSFSSHTRGAQLIEQSDKLTFLPGESQAVSFILKNKGDDAWKKTGSNKLTFQVSRSTSAIKHTTPKLLTYTANPGINAKVLFSITAPTKAGDYTLKIMPEFKEREILKEDIVIHFSVEDSTSLAKSEGENPIRIKLTPDSNTDPIIGATGSYLLYDDDTYIKTFPATQRVRVTQSGSSYKVSSGSYSQVLSGPIRFTPASDGDKMALLSMEQRPAWNTSLNDNVYRGTLEIRSVNGELITINELPLEYYLRGLAEVSNGDNPDKIKTILTVARSYAWFYMTQEEKFPGMPYHLDDDPNVSQKYLGYGYEKRSPNMTEAVIQTEGEVLTYNGSVIKTPYFSQTDGTQTRSAQEVWGWTHTPYLKSVDDSHCSSTSFAGHGVGLSGCGATALAEDGWNYEDILKYYYQGVELDTL